jgi:outer membrane protein, multidrug efflux system
MARIHFNMNTIMKPSLLFFIGMLVHLSLSSCALFAPDPRAPEQEALPAHYSNQAPAAETPQRWWHAFNAPQLNLLVEEALGRNFSLQESWARLRQAQAMAVKSGAALFPDLSLEAGASYGRQGTSAGNTITDPAEHYNLGLASRYELDLWGRIRSGRRADLLSASASREDLNAAAISLAANVVTRWIGVQSQRMQIELLKQQLKANLTLLELVELRFRKSLASALDVFQQRQVVAQSRALLPLVEQSERQLLNELAVLLGRTPFALPHIDVETLEIPADVPATGIPAQMLEMRPDIRSAMLRLQSADWEVAAARADRLPNISLTARATYQSDELSLLFDNWLLNLAGNLTAPLLDGRSRSAEVERQRAVVAEKLAAYRGLVLNAIREVEDALVGEAKLREHIAELQIQLEAARNALNEARSRYRSGLNDYLPVLTQIFSVQNLERTLIQRKADLLVARVDLYRALGGTWTETLTPRDMPLPQ